MGTYNIKVVTTKSKFVEFSYYITVVPYFLQILNSTIQLFCIKS